MRRIAIATGLALLLAACGGEDRTGGESYAAASAPAMEMQPPPPMGGVPSPAMKLAPDQDVRYRAPFDEQQQQGGGGQPAQPTQDPAAARLIAYTYYYGFQVPTQQMEGLLNAQKAGCESAGVSKCYVVSSQITGLGEEGASATLEMKAAAEWVTAFKTNLADSLKPFGADLDSSTVSSDDLTAQIIDTTARLNSNKTLRDRLQALLKDRPGKLSELLDIERELARVQGEIDATESILAAMKLRVSMSSLTLSYQPKYSAVSESIWQPLGAAFSDIVPNVVDGLAFMVRVVSGLLIWIVLIGGIIWFLIARAGRRRKVKTPPTRSGPAAPPAPAG